MTKKATCLGVKTRHVDRAMPAPYDKTDEKAKELFDTVLTQSALLRPIEGQIDILKAKAKPIQKLLDDAMTALQQGKSVLTPCTVTIDHTQCWIKITRDDTQETVVDRKAEESELDPDFFDE